MDHRLAAAWLVIITSSAVWEKVASDDVRVGFLAGANNLSAKLAAGTLSPENAEVAPALIFNLQLDAALALFFLVMLWSSHWTCCGFASVILSNKPVPPLSEVPHQMTRLEEAWQRD